MRSSGMNLDDGLEEILVEILEHEEKGILHPPAFWLDRFPAHREALLAFFENREAINGFLQDNPPAPPGIRLRYFGDFELLEEVGRGGMGIIYRALQKNLNREVALKMIRGDHFYTRVDLERFKKEAQAISQLDHPGIIPLLEIGEHQGRHYFTMKLVSGGNLADLLARGPCDQALAAEIIAVVARAVHYAHQRGFLHRDLKPANILLDSGPKPAPLVADFGLSKTLEGAGDPTCTGAILGTPAYMAPEQARGEKQLTTSVDVYSLGSILYELLTGKVPFRGSNLGETLDWLQHRDPQPLRQHSPSVDRDLETITLKCLAKAPAERYGSAEALADDLDRWRKGLPIQARPAGSLEILRKWARRKPVLAALSLALVVSVVTSLASMALMLRQASRAQEQITALAKAEADGKANAEQARIAAETQRDKAEERLYFNRTATAYRYWQDGNLAKAESLLLDSDTRFRSWEWHHLKKLFAPQVDAMPGMAFTLCTDKKTMFVFHKDRVALWDVPAWKEIRSFQTGDNRFVPSPDGTRYALLSPREIRPGQGPSFRLRVLDTQSGREIFNTPELPIVAFGIRTIAFSPDNSLIAVCGTQPFCSQGGDAGSTTAVIRGDTGELLYTIPDGGLHAAFSPDGKTLAAFTEKMSVDSSEQQPLPVGQPIPGAILWPEGRKLPWGDKLNRLSSHIRLLEAATGKQLAPIHPPENTDVGQDFAWSTDGRVLFSLQRGTTYLLDTQNGHSIGKLVGHTDIATAIACTSNPHLVLTGGLDRKILLWNTRDGKILREWKGHQNHVTSLALIGPGGPLLSAGADNTIRRWHFNQPPALEDHPLGGDPSQNLLALLGFPIPPKGEFHWAMGFSPDGSKSLVLDQVFPLRDWVDLITRRETPPGRYRVSLRDAKDLKNSRRFPSDWLANFMPAQDMKFHFSPSGKFAAACFREQPVIYDLNSGTEHFLPFRSGSVLAFGTIADSLATAQPWEGQVYQPEQPVPGIPACPPPQSDNPLKDGIPPELQKPSGELLPLPPFPGVSHASLVRFWNASSRQQVGSVSLFNFHCEGLAYSPDGALLACWGQGPYVTSTGAVSAPAEVRLVDTREKKEIRVLKGSPLNHRQCAFSPDGKWLTAASWDGNVYVWSVSTGKLFHTLRGHQGYVWSSCFSTDGKRVFSSGNDGCLKVWDFASGEEIISFQNEGGKYQLEMTQDGALRGHGDFYFRTWLTAAP